MRKVAIDTNILIRLLVDDDPVQRAAVMELGNRLNVSVIGLITMTSLLELDWALRSQYGYSRAASIEAMRRVIRIRGIEIECHDTVVLAIRTVEDRNADFADALIATRAIELGCSATLTLDRRAARDVPGMELLA